MRYEMSSERINDIFLLYAVTPLRQYSLLALPHPGWSVGFCREALCVFIRVIRLAWFVVQHNVVVVGLVVVV
jgi:hypothetical protein